MILLLIVLLIVAAAAGVLWQVLEIAAGVALGLFLFVVLVAVASYLLVRHRFRQFRREWHGERRPRGRPRY